MRVRRPSVSAVSVRLCAAALLGVVVGIAPLTAAGQCVGGRCTVPPQAQPFTPTQLGGAATGTGALSTAAQGQAGGPLAGLFQPFQGLFGQSGTFLTSFFRQPALLAASIIPAISQSLVQALFSNDGPGLIGLETRPRQPRDFVRVLQPSQRAKRGSPPPSTQARPDCTPAQIASGACEERRVGQPQFQLLGASGVGGLVGGLGGCSAGLAGIGSILGSAGLGQGLLGQIPGLTNQMQGLLRPLSGFTGSLNSFFAQHAGFFSQLQSLTGQLGAFNAAFQQLFSGLDPSLQQQLVPAATQFQTSLGDLNGTVGGCPGGVCPPGSFGGGVPQGSGSCPGGVCRP